MSCKWITIILGPKSRALNYLSHPNTVLTLNTYPYARHGSKEAVILPIICQIWDRSDAAGCPMQILTELTTESRSAVSLRDEVESTESIAAGQGRSGRCVIARSRRRHSLRVDLDRPDVPQARSLRRPGRFAVLGPSLETQPPAPREHPRPGPPDLFLKPLARRTPTDARRPALRAPHSGLQVGQRDPARRHGSSVAIARFLQRADRNAAPVEPRRVVPQAVQVVV